MRTPETIRPELHGTYNGYTNYRCRCDECKAAARVAQMGAKSRRQNPPPHGTYNSYINYACRCRACKAANTEHARGYRQRKASS